MPDDTTRQSGPRQQAARWPVSLARWSASPVIPGPDDCLAQVRAGIARAQRLLTNPSAAALLQCEVCLRELADRLRQFPATLRKTEASGGVDRIALLHAAGAAQQELAYTATLLQNAGCFYSFWIRHFSALRCGYTRTGSPARLTCASQTSARG